MRGCYNNNNKIICVIIFVRNREIGAVGLQERGEWETGKRQERLFHGVENRNRFCPSREAGARERLPTTATRRLTSLRSNLSCAGEHYIARKCARREHATKGRDARRRRGETRRALTKVGFSARFPLFFPVLTMREKERENVYTTKSRFLSFVLLHSSLRPASFVAQRTKRDSALFTFVTSDEARGVISSGAAYHGLASSSSSYIKEES